MNTFQIGDRVVCIKDHHSGTSKGDSGTVYSISYLGIKVDFDKSYNWVMQEEDLMLESDYLKLNSSLMKAGAAYKSLSSNIGLGGLVREWTLSTPVTEKSSHTHIWKNYQGLSYQEEYCSECNETKNRRGLFE